MGGEKGEGGMWLLVSGLVEVDEDENRDGGGEVRG